MYVARASTLLLTVNPSFKTPVGMIQNLPLEAYDSIIVKQKLYTKCYYSITAYWDN